MASPPRFERGTYGVEDRYSIQLNYGEIIERKDILLITLIVSR